MCAVGGKYFTTDVFLNARKLHNLLAKSEKINFHKRGGHPPSCAPPCRAWSGLSSCISRVCSKTYWHLWFYSSVLASQGLSTQFQRPWQTGLSWTLFTWWQPITALAQCLPMHSTGCWYPCGQYGCTCPTVQSSGTMLFRISSAYNLSILHTLYT